MAIWRGVFFFPIRSVAPATVGVPRAWQWSESYAHGSIWAVISYIDILKSRIDIGGRKLITRKSIRTCLIPVLQKDRCFQRHARCIICRIYQQLLPHIESLYKSEVSGEEPVKDLAKVLNYAARYIQTAQGKYEEAERLNRRALERCKKERRRKRIRHGQTGLIPIQNCKSVQN